MINSMNARRGAANTMKMTNFEFRAMKKEVKDSIVSKDANIVTSDYFKYFDCIESQSIHDKQNYYLNMAAKAAMKSDMNHKHGAIIVHKKKYRCHWFQLLQGRTQHSRGS